ncbi:LCP family protein [Streptomyces lomondensis]|uniref:Transcriptional regulator n=1 Tax=Streptomyces lomondensis TaxID=68229 RepID=A0ABQ2XP20_9ACTN|nr:LCP family protein [Streptomyces lomondensis]MCF0080952.1 LCP family protein [Streptomyces lomondensis]GGX25285.1 transcriptional regulator [Streptomyces lomondensis]
MARSSGVYGEGTKPGARPRVPVQDPGRHDRAPGPDGDGPGGSGGTGGSGGPGGSGGRPGRGRRVLRWSATALSLLVLVTAGAGYLYYEHLNGNINKGRRSSGDSRATKAEPNAAGQTPLNILLIGSDSRASDENVKLGGGRDSRGNPPLGDVQMLIHLAADRRSASVVTVPRDTRVDIPECTDPATGKTYPPVNAIINTSLARGGAGCTLATWENLTGAYIDHWMTIDFAGVVRMADAVGGVEVCVRQNVWDRSLPGVPGGSGLKLTAGRKKIQGEQALQWLRTRHAWGSDPLRARAQHMYMNAMIRTLKAQNVFTDTGRLTDLAEAATKSLHVSEEIGTVKKLYDLGTQLRTVPTDRITMTTLPTAQDPQDANHLVPAGADADRVWSMIRDDVPFDGRGRKPGPKPKPKAGNASQDPAAADGEIGVLVRNATRSGTLGPVGGRAGAVAQSLVGKGFTKAAADTSGALSEERTVVRYPSAELEGDARRVAKSLGIPGSSVQRSTDVSGVTVDVGADWRTGTAYPKQPAPNSGALPGDADALNGSDAGPCMDVYGPYRW